nr:DUF6455 family protein [uncultured Ruegeria sp.]
MLSRNTLRRHAGLLDQMATTVGVDLEEAAIAGQVSIDAISDAVLRCTDCPNPGHCENFLTKAVTTSQTPEYCRNQELLNKLKP